MRIFKIKAFNKWAKNLLSEDSLVIAVNELEAGNFDASLGQKVFKQRVATDAGKSGGARTIVAFHEGDNVFFMYGFGKDKRANISDTEKKALQKLAKAYFSMDSRDIATAIKAKELVEITQKT